MLVDVAPILDFLSRFLLIGLTAVLVAAISLGYADAVTSSAFWGLYQESGCFVVIGLGLVLVAVVVSYWIF